MKLVIEVHKYAPEQNKVHIWHNRQHKGVLDAPGCTSIAEARRRLFKPVKFMVFAEINVTNNRAKEFPFLNTTHRGRVENRKAALKFRDERQIRSRGGPLIDGTYLPPSTLRVKTFTTYL